jgi:hypothetical protein
MRLITLLLAALFNAGVSYPGVPHDGLTAPAHDYHVSKTNVRYVADRRQLQVEMHLFVDDLEGAMMEAGAPRLRLGTPDQHEESDRYLTAYLDKHFGVDWDADRLALELVGYELADDLHGIWIYLAADDLPPAAERIAVENSVLTEYYADQKNIVKLYRDDERVATLLMDRARTSGSSEF